jgi:hypothetical protein
MMGQLRADHEQKQELGDTMPCLRHAARRMANSSSSLASTRGRCRFDIGAHGQHLMCIFCENYTRCRAGWKGGLVPQEHVFQDIENYQEKWRRLEPSVG